MLNNIINMFSSHKIFIHLFITVLLLTISIYGNEIEIKCTNIDEYYFSKPGTYCKTYYKCTNDNQKDLKECGPGSMFDFYTQTCTRNSGICYEPICTGRTNGIYADTTHACRRYFTCHSGHLINIDNCPQSKLHNGKECINQDLVMCELPHTTAIGYPFSGDQRCLNRSNGYYGIENCTKYLQCYEQNVVDIKNCPKRYRFSSIKQECIQINDNDDDNHDGNGNHINSLCVDLEISAIDSDLALCKYKIDGHYPDPKSIDCISFVMCKDEQFIGRDNCTYGTVFNGDMCVPSPIYTCNSISNWAGNKIERICKHKRNGFYANPIKGCSSYVRCMLERAVEMNDCPHGQYFDPDEKICVYEKFLDRIKCKSPKKSSDCNNKAEGFYQEYDCHSYYYCYNGYKIEYKCSDNKLFNGEECISETEYVCSNLLENSCFRKSDGYYKDDKINNRSYYYCLNGNKIMYYCEKGYNFDGIKCVQNERSSSSNNNNGNNENSITNVSNDSICYNKTNGYYPDLESNCHNYIYCQNNEKLIQLTCRNGKIFNGEKCIHKNFYTCPNHKNHLKLNCLPKSCIKMNCANNSNGFYMDIESKCKNYFFCINGKKTILSCMNGQLFNGQICVSEDQFTCPIYCNNNDDDIAGNNDEEDDDENFLMKNSSCPLSGQLFT